MDMSASKPEPGDEEDVEKAVPENKLSLDNVETGFWLFKMALNSFMTKLFYDMNIETKANS